MRRLIIFLSIFLVIIISPSLCLGKPEVDKKNSITLKEGLLSIDAHDTSPEDILKELGEVCSIKIVVNENSFPDTLVSIKFKELPVDEGVKKILKATRVQNYIVQYQEVGNRNYVSGIEFLGNKSESRILTPGQKIPIQQTKVVPKTTKKKTNTTSSVVNSKEDMDDKIEALEEKFEWDDEKTLELFKDVLHGAPPQARKYSLKSMTKSIKNYLKEEGGRAVDKEMVYKAAVEAVPPDMPGMKEKVREYLDSLNKK